MVVVFNVMNIILQTRCSNGSNVGKMLNIESGKEKPPRIIFLALYEKTKGGKILFAVLNIYMMFASITLPVIHYYKAKHLNSHYFKDVSIFFFIYLQYLYYKYFTIQYNK